MATQISGNWVASNVGGQTVYVSNGVTISGPVLFTGGGTLTVASGATVSGLSAVASGGYPTVVVSGGSLIDSTVDNGYLRVSNGGVTSNVSGISTETNYYSGSTSLDETYSWVSPYDHSPVRFSSGAVASNAHISNGVNVYVSSGATVNGLEVTSGASVLVSSGAVLSSLSITAGGSATILADYGAPRPLTTTPTSNVSVLRGTWSAVNSGGVTVYVSGNVVSQGPVRMSGGTLIVMSGATASGVSGSNQGGYPVVSVMSGGTLLSSVITNGYLYMSSGGASVGNSYNSLVATISAGATSINDIYYNSGFTNDTIYVASGATMYGAEVASGVLIYASSGSTLKDPVVVSGGSLTIAGGTVITCFLAGSLIETEAGEKAIEDFTKGDLVTVYRHGMPGSEPVIHLVKDRVMVRRHLPDDEAGYPVRIAAGAFGPGQPYQDLLVTAEHCFFFEGAFVPIRMLVNGVSIAYDRSFDSYEYYHIGTAEHGIIRANGVLSETLLDGENPALSGRADIKVYYRAWAQDAAAPLRTDREFVAPIYEAISARIGDGAIIRRDMVLEHDPGLHLVTEGGLRIPCARKQGENAMFLIPPDVREVCIASRVARPVDIEGPCRDDRRKLGVLVGDVTLYSATETRRLEDHLRALDIEGWAPLETSEHRWTTGEAAILLGDRKEEEPAVLSVTIRAGGPYLPDTGKEGQRFKF
ncbi:Hint domain-containing protein [Asaia spathodeae]|uniref:Hint domain-containing protein n=1 Tax=Asaia spathodeae TaxID=657016 RepID=A0ABX2P3A9_9PROT|nr:Hint domain-containing protein [Asaia spathodeae]GBR21336.1 hypothetical protein AA105894_2764 [Asaia spathodeae NBRC 105894]